MEQLGSHRTDFRETWYLDIFRRIVEKIQIEIGQEQRVLYVKTNIHFWSYLAQFFLEWGMFQTKIVEKIKIRILFSVTFFFFKSCRL